MENGKAAKHFGSCREFYEKTRPGEIRELCTELYRELNPGKEIPSFGENGEMRSWLRSLPDLAELLYDPGTYREKTIREGRALLASLDERIAALEAFASCGALRDLLRTPECAALLSSPGAGGINQAVDHDTMTALTALGSSLSLLNGGGLVGIAENLRKQREELAKALAMLDEEKIRPGLTVPQVDVEYPVFDDGTGTVKRIDVLLSDPDRKRYAIVELKQWTEDSIRISVSEEKEKPECLVSVVPGNRSQMHPAMKVRDVYKKALQAQLNDEEAVIRCFVYLHNQMYSDSRLFRVSGDVPVDIYDDCPWPNNILYTKLWHGRLLNRLADLFGERQA